MSFVSHDNVINKENSKTNLKSMFFMFMYRLYKVDDVISNVVPHSSDINDHNLPIMSQ